MLAAGEQVVVGGLVEKEMVFARRLLELVHADPVQVHLQLGVAIVVRYSKAGGVKTTNLFLFFFPCFCAQACLDHQSVILSSHST